MKVQWIKAEERLGAARGEAVVCIPVYGGHEMFVECLSSVLAHTPPQTRILVCDDASPDPRSQELVRTLERRSTFEHELFYLRQPQNLGFPANVNSGFAAAAPADVVVLNSDCLVGEGWLEGLRDAAYVDGRVATATALTNHGSLASVCGQPMPSLPPEWGLDQAAAAIRGRSLKIRPRIPTAIGHCVFIRRSALELIGDFDLAFSPGYGEEVDLSQRCLRGGLCHVLADDVLVAHYGGGSFSANARRTAIQDAHEEIVKARYPYYYPGLRELEDDTGPIARSLSVARRALKGLSVTVDARIPSGPMTGTQLHVLELISALSRHGGAQLSVLVGDQMDGYAASALHSLPEVTLMTQAEASTKGSRADVLHRPFQINDGEDLAFLARLGERLVVTQQDLISYHNASYFRDVNDWDSYRRLTRGTLAVADRVVFFSEHARQDALAEDLVEPARTSVVRIGVDHTFTGTDTQLGGPRGAERLPVDAPVILCLGTNFRHKNRVFALRLLDELQRRHDWPGYLALAGPRVSHGASAPEEAELLALHPDLAQATVSLAAVGDAEKAWLYARSRLVIYPSVHEGFGLIPFEAADHGVPCMWAQGTSLSEVLPDEAAELVPWDTELSAVNAMRLLSDEQAREHNLVCIRSAAVPLTWDATAATLIELYGRTCDAPAAPAGSFDRRQGPMQGALSEDAMRLLGPGGALPDEATRPLLALATHPRVGTPIFQAIEFGYQFAYRMKRVTRAVGTRRRADRQKPNRSP